MYHFQTYVLGLFPFRLHAHRGRAVTHLMDDPIVPDDAALAAAHGSGDTAPSAAAIAASSGTIGSSMRWVTARPRWAWSRNGNSPSTYVWKWYMR